MRYFSTRQTYRRPELGLALHEALNAGLAPDGGLYIPEQLPKLDLGEWSADWTLAQTSAWALRAFFVGSTLAADLGDICAESLNLPMPQVTITSGGTHAAMLELFHGPTAAFKDFAARFLAACMKRLLPAGQQATVLVATSGDTGGAVAAAFHHLPGFSVCILYPDGRVSPRQAHQLGSFGGNVGAYKIQGSFDDCQAMVKSVFSDQDLRARCNLLSANSISLGRLLPQMAYYVDASLRFRSAHGRAPSLIIPSGNLGNGLGAILARSLGAPIADVVLACNANEVLPRFFATGHYRPKASLSTLANAMDVGNPSNFERLKAMFRQPEGVLSVAVSDHEIRRLVHQAPERFGHVVCPHTACALAALEIFSKSMPNAHWLLAATAHPAKFNEAVEPLIQKSIALPDSLRAMLAAPANALAMAADVAALKSLLLTKN